MVASNMLVLCLLATSLFWPCIKATCTVQMRSTGCTPADGTAGSVSAACDLTLNGYTGPSRNFTTQSHKSPGLDPFFKLAKHFIDIVAKVPPWEAIGFFLSSNTSAAISSVTAWERTRFFIAAGFGIVWVLMALFGGFIFCFCRYGGNCGGSDLFVTKKSDQTCLFVLSLCVGLTSCFLLGSATLMYLTNARVGQAVDVFKSTFDQSVERITAFTNDTSAEVKYVTTDQVDFLVARLLDQISDLGNEAGRLVLTNFEGQINQTASSARELILLANSSIVLLSTMQRRTDTVQMLLRNISISLSNASIPAQMPPCLPCMNINNQLAKAVNSVPSVMFPDIDSSIASVRSVAGNDLSQQLDDGLIVFRTLPCTIKNQTNAIEKTVGDQIRNYKTQIDERVAPLLGTIGPNLTERLGVDDWRRSVNNYADQYKSFDRYRIAAGYTLACFSIVVLVCLCAGMTFGCCGFDSSAKPSSRSSASDCGGKIIMVGVYLSFIFMFFLALLSTIVFFVGGHLHVMCPSIRSLEIFTRTVDDVPRLYKTHFLDGVLHNNKTVNLTIRSVLESCKAGNSSYSSLRLDQQYNISSILDSSEIIDLVDTQLGRLNSSVTIDTSSILTDATRNSLRSFNSTGLQTLNVSSILSQIQDSPVSSELVKNVTAIYSMALAVPMLAAAQRTALETSQGHFNNTVLYVNQTLEVFALLQDDIVRLNNLSATVSAKIEFVLSNADNLTARVQAFSRTVASQTGSLYSDRIKRWINEFFAYANIYVTQTAANCRPLYDIYSNIESVLCDFTVDTLNGFWLACGWAAFFFIPAVIFGTMLSRYYLQMRYDEGFDEQSDMGIIVQKVTTF